MSEQQGGGKVMSDDYADSIAVRKEVRGMLLEIAKKLSVDPNALDSNLTQTADLTARSAALVDIYRAL